MYDNELRVSSIVDVTDTKGVNQYTGQTIIHSSFATVGNVNISVYTRSHGVKRNSIDKPERRVEESCQQEEGVSALYKNYPCWFGSACAKPQSEVIFGPGESSLVDNDFGAVS